MVQGFTGRGWFPTRSRRVAARRHGRALRRLLGVVAFAGLMAGCSSADDPQSTGSADEVPTPTAPSAATSPTATGSAPSPTGDDIGTAELAEPFRLVATGIDGSPIALADYAATPVALWFWAPT